jgi:hypothetical protein
VLGDMFVVFIIHNDSWSKSTPNGEEKLAMKFHDGDVGILVVDIRTILDPKEELDCFALHFGRDIVSRLSGD